jgi:hypothetical protein
MEVQRQTMQYIKQKRKWLKAYEVLEDIVMEAKEIATKKEENIFKYQFLLNFLTQPTSEERVRFILETLQLIPNYREFFELRLVAVLERRKVASGMSGGSVGGKGMGNSVPVRTSRFLIEELANVRARIDGSF